RGSDLKGRLRPPFFLARCGADTFSRARHLRGGLALPSYRAPGGGPLDSTGMTQTPRGFTHSLAVRLGRGWSFVRRHPFWLIALVPLVAALYIAALVPSTPSIENIQKLRTQQPSVVLSADGK